jgi:SRSO17 transposase
MDKGELLRMEPALDAFLGEFRDCAAAPTRRLISAYVRGQLGSLPRKSVRPIARAAGIAPRTLQELLSLHKWDADRMRTLAHRRAWRAYGGCGVVAYLHASACPKRGNKTPGVERQAIPGSSRAGNCCVVVHLGLVRGPFRCVLDSEVYLPRGWTEDAARREAAGIPPDLGYRAAGRIGLDLVGRAEAGGLRFDRIFLARGLADPPLFPGDRPFLAEVEGSLRGWVGREASPERPGATPLADLEEARSVAKGEGRVLPFRLEHADRPLRLVVDRPGERAIRFFLANATPDVSAERLLDCARDQDTWEGQFASDRDAIGFGHFEVRTYRSIQRHFTLSTLAFLFQAEARATRSEGRAREAAY